MIETRILATAQKKQAKTKHVRNCRLIVISAAIWIVIGLHYGTERCTSCGFFRL